MYVILVLLILGFSFGRYFEKRHYKSIRLREQQYLNTPIVTSEWRNEINSDEEGTVVGSGIVVASDYFKTFVSYLISIFGGRMTTYESLIDRGRREATLRMKAKAVKWGADRIVNFRIETSTVGNVSQNKKGLPCVELFAYGTAIRKKKNV